jgi:hypothetical protein
MEWAAEGNRAVAHLSVTLKEGRHLPLLEAREAFSKLLQDPSTMWMLCSIWCGARSQNVFQMLACSSVALKALFKAAWKCSLRLLYRLLVSTCVVIVGLFELGEAGCCTPVSYQVQ